jgi:soluble lytic murein transglycosylase-like protein
VPNNQYDDLFDQWGRALNVDPQLGKTVFHMESSGGKNTNRSLPNDPDSPTGPMQMRPSTAAGLAKTMGIDGPLDLQDMRYAVPLAMGYLAQGLTATETPKGPSAEGALGYYYSGSGNPAAWGPKTQAYIRNGQALYPQMGLAPTPAAQPSPAP